MKTKLFHTLTVAILVSLFMLAFACSNDDWNIDAKGTATDVLARPRNLRCDMSNEPEYVFSWGRVVNAKSYVFELYREGVLDTLIAIDDPTSIEVAQLSSPTFIISEMGTVQYLAKVKAMDANGKSSLYAELGVATPDYVEFSPSERFKDTVQWAIKNNKSILLLPGDYAGYGGTVYLQDNAFVMKAKDPNNRPTNVALAFRYYAKNEDANTRGSINIKDIDFDGGKSGGESALGNFLDFPVGSADNIVNSDTTTYTSNDGFVLGDVAVKNCGIRSYTTTLLRSSGSAGSLDNATIESVVVDNCVVEHFIGGNNDFIDLRTINMKSVSIKNTTFNSVGIGRAFIRADAGTKGSVSIDHCTMHNVSNDGTATASSLFYMRSPSDAPRSLSVTNCLITFAAIATQAANNGISSDGISYSNNAYFGMSSNAMSRDETKTELSENPYAGNPADDFTLPAESPLRTGGVGSTCIGDPRWAQ